jgi:hypothetical protein
MVWTKTAQLRRRQAPFPALRFAPHVCHTSGGLWGRYADTECIVGTREYSHDHALRSTRSRSKAGGDREVREISFRANNCGCNGSTKLEGTYKSDYIGASQLMLLSRKALKRLVDVTGFEPATPCLQSRSPLVGPLSIVSHKLLHSLIFMVASTLPVSHPFG